jgi:hypothetical protein
MDFFCEECLRRLWRGSPFSTYNWCSEENFNPYPILQSRKEFNSYVITWGILTRCVDYFYSMTHNGYPQENKGRRYYSISKPVDHMKITFSPYSSPLWGEIFDWHLEAEGRSIMALGCDGPWCRVNNVPCRRNQVAMNNLRMLK